MRIAKIVSFLGLLAMSGIILRGFIVGNFSAEGNQLLAMPWGQVSMVDLYTGFILFSGWIVYREKSIAAKGIWILLMLTLGNWTASLYVFLALQNSGGDWKRFWLGYRAT